MVRTERIGPIRKREIITDNLRKRRDFIWVTVAGLLNASESVVMLMIVTRRTNVDDAGILILAFALNNLFMTIGKYGIKNFQVTDVKNQFHFMTYLKTRVITVFCMLVVLVGYLLFQLQFGDYDLYKCKVIFVLGIIYMIEALEDVFWGFYQRQGYLYKGAWLFVARWSTIFIVFGVVIAVTGNMLTALILGMLASPVVFLIMLGLTLPSVRQSSLRQQPITEQQEKQDRGGSIPELLTTAFPLFLVSFMMFFVSNNAKYAIDAQLTSEVQACYGFVSMPVFVTGLITSFIYQPQVVSMAKLWAERKTKLLAKEINKQIIIATMLTLVVITGAYICGIPVLSWLYHVDLTEYKVELMILMVASGFLAISNFLAVVNNVMRNQKKQMYAYSAITVVSFSTMNFVVRRFGTFGAACEYTILLLVLCVIYYAIVRRTMKREKAENLSNI